MTTPAMKSIYRHVLDVIGGEPEVAGCLRDNGPEEVDVLYVADAPSQGLTAYATIGMYEGETGNRVDGKPLRVELVGMCASAETEYVNMLASCAFNVLTGEYGIKPGNIFPDVIGQYRPDVTMKHMLFVPVFSWEGLSNLEVDGIVITWLQAVPMGQREARYAREHGAEAVQTLLEQRNVDVADLNREQVV